MFARARHLTIVLAVAALAAPSAAAAAADDAPVNTGTKGSVCRSLYVPGDADPALDSTSLGDLAADYEVGAPAGGGTPQRVMLFLHGGGWYRIGTGMLATERAGAAAWQAAGWETVNATYRSCRNSLASVLETYDAVRASVGPSVPICVKGESAGGQLALMLAARRPDVACVIAAAAPTDLYTIKSQGTAEGIGDGARSVFGFARAAFRRRNLADMSPVGHVDTIRARLLLAVADDDKLIPLAQQQELTDLLRAADPAASVDLDVLAPGDQDFVHGSASTAALKELEGRITALVAPFGTAPVTASPRRPLLSILFPKISFFRRM